MGSTSRVLIYEMFRSQPPESTCLAESRRRISESFWTVFMSGQRAQKATKSQFKFPFQKFFKTARCRLIYCLPPINSKIVHFFACLALSMSAKFIFLRRSEEFVELFINGSFLCSFLFSFCFIPFYK